MVDFNQSIPSSAPVQSNGQIDPAWQTFFLNLFNRTGGPTGLLNGDNFAPQDQGFFFASPPGGGPAEFRQIQASDLTGVQGQFPGTTTNDNASAGNVGEYIFSEIASGSAVALTTATIADITSITLTPGDWDVWANFATAPAATTTQSLIQAWINTQSASDPTAPNNGAYLNFPLAIAAGKSLAMPIGSMRVTVQAGGNQTVYLSGAVTFSVSTLGGYGFLGARRRR